MKPAQSLGFTLIELIVTIAIITIIFSLTIATYRSFQTKQELTQASKNLTTNLRFAQSQAFAGVKGPSCTASSPSPTLVGWYLRKIPGAEEYRIYSRCVGKEAELYRKIPLPNGVQMQIPGNADILFQPVNQDVIFGKAEEYPPKTKFDEISIKLTNNSGSVTVIVKSTGSIYEQ